MEPNQKLPIPITPPPTKCELTTAVLNCFKILAKKLSKPIKEEEDEKMFETVLLALKLTPEKDTFFRLFTISFVNRLLDFGQVSLDVERRLINGIHTVLGRESVLASAPKRNHHLMIEDIAASRELSKDFHDAFSEANGMIFDAKILQTDAWPLHTCPLINLKLPPALGSVIRRFSLFYGKNGYVPKRTREGKKGRRLTWIHQASIGEMELTYTSRPYRVLLSTYLMVILLLFQDKDELSFSEIMKCTGITESYLTKHMAILVGNHLLYRDNRPGPGPSLTPSTSKKAPILIDAFDTQTAFHLETHFKLNFNFANKHSRFALLLPGT